MLIQLKVPKVYQKPIFRNNLTKAKLNTFFLKGQSHEIFCTRDFFYQSDHSGPNRDDLYGCFDFFDVFIELLHF